MAMKDLKALAKEMNEVMGLDPKIKLVGITEEELTALIIANAIGADPETGEVDPEDALAAEDKLSPSSWETLGDLLDEENEDHAAVLDICEAKVEEAAAKAKTSKGKGKGKEKAPKAPKAPKEKSFGRFTGKEKIKVLKKEHGVRAGTFRANLMDAIGKCKTVADACEATAHNPRKDVDVKVAPMDITFAIGIGYIEVN